MCPRLSTVAELRRFTVSAVRMARLSGEEGNCGLRGETRALVRAAHAPSLGDGGVLAVAEPRNGPHGRSVDAAFPDEAVVDVDAQHTADDEEIIGAAFVKVSGDKQHPSNFGRLCTKGATHAEMMAATDEVMTKRRTPAARIRSMP